MCPVTHLVFVCLFHCLLASDQNRIDGKSVAVTEQTVPNNHFGQITENLTVRCYLCDEDSCITLEGSRCQYLLEVNKLKVKEEDEDAVEYNKEFQDDVQNLLLDVVHRALSENSSRECIPLISKYTNCNKDSKCFGCTTCFCEKGRWECRTEQRCSQMAELNVDHNVLVTAMENLIAKGNDSLHIRPKRSASRPMMAQMYEDGQDWVRQIKSDRDFPFGVRGKILSPSNIDQNSDPYAFNEIIKRLGIDDFINEKLEETPHDSRDQPFEVDKLPDMTELEKERYTSTTERVSTRKGEFVVKVINTKWRKPAGKYVPRRRSAPSVIKDYMDIDKDISDYYKSENDEKPKRQRKIKRDLQCVNSTNENNLPLHKEELRKQVIKPLKNIIKEKKKEVSVLEGIKRKLKTILNDYITNNSTDSSDNEINSTEDSKFTIYKLKVYPKNYDGEDRRRAIYNTDKLTMLQMKLRKDIFELLRDLNAIRKLSKNKDLPEDLKRLLRYMKSFIQKQMQFENKSSINELRFEQFDWKNKTRKHSETKCYIKDHLISLLEVLDTDTHARYALDNLSGKVKIVTKRIISQLYENDMINGESINSPQFNLSYDLNSINGSNLVKTANELEGSAVHDLLFKLKWFNILLSNDIEQLKNAGAALDFANKRQLTHLENEKDESLVDKIHRDLVYATDEVTKFFNNREQNTVKDEKTKVPFITRFKTLIKHPKKSFLKVIHRNKGNNKYLHKGKEIKINVNDLRDYETVMRRWQEDMNITKRFKREAQSISRFRNRMKNILPRYLRRKVNPALAKKRNRQRTMRNRLNTEKGREKVKEQNSVTDIKTKEHRNQKKEKSNLKHSPNTTKV